MQIGIDVGGTFTDGVLIENAQVLRSCKVPTDSQALLKSIVHVLEKLIEEKTEKISRIVVSTTLMTNLILEKKYLPTGLILIPGPGLNLKEHKFPFSWEIITGGVDFQGRIIKNLNEQEIVKKVQCLVNKGIQHLGIIGKFSPRNPSLEIQTAEIVNRHFPTLEVKLGHQVTGQLNFIRRAMGTGLYLATYKTFAQFIASLKNALKERDITCPVFILKADGGVIPIDKIMNFTIDTVLSGPAASSFGAKSLLPEKTSAFVMDIGGTTTDFSLILDGNPLLASRGVKISDVYTPVRSLAIHSLPIGGDTGIEIKNNQVTLTFKREGPPACCGGNTPTLTDCMRILNLTDLGDENKARLSFQSLSSKLDLSAEIIAQQALDKAVELITQEINYIFKQWQEEPLYRIWQLLNEKNIKPRNLISIGGPGKPLGELVSKKMNLTHINHPLCQVANAIGAALASPTYEETIRINTEKREISSSWGYFSKNSRQIKGNMSAEEAAGLALQIFKKYLQENGVEAQPEIYHQEVFNMVRGWSTTGQIHEIKLGVPVQVTGLINNKE